MTKEQVTEKILAGLQRQKFADWYNRGNFDKWISDREQSCLDEMEIKMDIEKLFDLK